MIAFLSRLFGGRPDAPAWIEAADLQRRLTGGPVLLVDVRQPEEFTAPPGHLPGAINVPLGDLAATPTISPRAGSPSFWCARPTAARHVPPPSCSPRACAMSLYCVVAPMAGTHGASPWNDARAGWRAGRPRVALSVHLLCRRQMTETTFTFRVDEALKAAFTEAARAPIVRARNSCATSCVTISRRWNTTPGSAPRSSRAYGSLRTPQSSPSRMSNIVAEWEAENRSSGTDGAGQA